MKLTSKQRTQLRGLGHKLKPVVMIGNAGFTDAVLEELDGALEHPELLNVKVSSGDREARDAIIASMCERAGAELVQRVGNMALIYRRRHKNARIILES